MSRKVAKCYFRTGSSIFCKNDLHTTSYKAKTKPRYGEKRKITKSVGKVCLITLTVQKTSVVNVKQITIALLKHGFWHSNKLKPYFFALFYFCLREKYDLLVLTYISI